MCIFSQYSAQTDSQTLVIAAVTGGVVTVLIITTAVTVIVIVVLLLRNRRGHNSPEIQRLYVIMTWKYCDNFTSCSPVQKSSEYS